MEPFSLEKYLENPSRKVVTRREKPVRIICTDRKHGEDDLPIVFLEENNGGEFLLTCRNDGKCDNYDTPYDLFFADEEPESIEIPFGAKDSEFIKDEYYIPEGCEARIEGNKVVIEKIQKEEVTEFERALDVFAYNSKLGASNPNYYDWLLKSTALNLLDLARKEILKDLPKWKKANKETDFEERVLIYEDDYICYDDHVYIDDYYIERNELKKLPKEE